MTMTEDYLQEIIKLQLKKPKNWNWQLSTSKSSPHIALPIIQLYDAKGHLLLEAKDNAGTQRRSWHSAEIAHSKELPTNVKKGFRESTARHLQRCRSDTLDHNLNRNFSRNKHESINFRERNKTNNKLIKSSSAIIEHSSISRKNGESVNENRKPRDSVDNAIKRKAVPKENLYHLQKSTSEVVAQLKGYNGPQIRPSNSSQSIHSKTRTTVEIDTPRRHKRSQSDDLFRRKLKYNEESLKRAETDGYKNFITSPNSIPEDKSPSSPKAPKNIRSALTAENVLLSNNISNMEVNRFQHRRYKTRTSSAGTLIISEETFNNPQRRRRRQRDADASIQNAQALGGNDNAIAGLSKDTTMEKKGTSVRHTSSDPINSKSMYSRGKQVANSYAKCQQLDDDEPRTPCRSPDGKSSSSTAADLFYSLSQVFPFKHILNGEDNLDDNSNYIVQEPITTPDESRKNSCPATIEKLKKKKRRKLCPQHSSDGSTSSTSSSTIELKGSRTKGHLIKEHSAKPHRNNTGKAAADLLQLVRRLSSDHVKMGANVSRHSAKGLSGRRSQSSGSICNGKGGRHNDGKICSSLPSYLDDGDSNGCNNNHHDCEKPPLEEVERIPPLGDGAPLHWKFSDNQTALCDQGYGSERSPEEEYPPPLPDHDIQCHHHLEPHACYPFITPESTFTVKLTKGSRGLGLSVTGGIDSTGSWPGLIRIKRLFPHQPASACGLLNVGDLLLEANGITLTGLTNYEALEVLRTAPNQVDLRVCRPPPDVLNCVSPISEVPPPPPRREPPTSLNLPSAVFSTPEDDYYHGEFEVTLTKIQGSLGFTLRKEDDSALGHYVRALVREPALTDGRIRAGDKIIAVNEVEISAMSHEQAVQFLRQCGDIVKLRLYRDAAQTPVAALSPTETTPRASFSRKAHLRQEAVDMLNDIAVRKLIPGNQDTYRRSLSPNASPRRLRRQPCPSDASQITDSSTKYLSNDEQFHEGLLQKCSHPFDDDAFNSLFYTESEDGDKPSRPSSLELYNPNQTPVAARKPRFNFSLAHNAYELNNLDPEVLDAPNLTYNLGNDDVKSTDVECGDSFPQEPASMPHIPIDNSTFSYKNPAYQSAHPHCGLLALETNEDKSTASHKTSIKKWDGVVLSEKPSSSSTKKCHTHKMPMQEEYEVLAIELNRGWNSRLGFSLQGAAGVTYVSAVHADSVAAKDGRLKPGDRVIKVNDESVENLNTNEIIDLLRIVRGPVCIVVSRIKSHEDCPKSNAAN